MLIAKNKKAFRYVVSKLRTKIQKEEDGLHDAVNIASTSKKLLQSKNDIYTHNICYLLFLLFCFSLQCTNKNIGSLT